MPDDQGPNMEIRAFIAVVLSLAVMLGYQYFFAPTPPAPGIEAAVEGPELPAGPGPEAVPITPPEAETGAAPLDTTAAAGAPVEQEAASERIGAEQRRNVLVETERYRMQIDNRGGRITSVVLKDYTSDFDGPVDLVIGEPGFEPAGMLEFTSPGMPEVAARANEALYEVSVNGVAASPTIRVDEPTEILMRWADGRGASVDKRLTVNPDGYLSDFTVSVQDPSGTPMFITLGPGLEMHADTTRAGIYLTRGALRFDGSELVNVADAEIEGPEVLTDVPVLWGGIQSNYFVALLAPQATVTVLIDAAPLPLEEAEQAVETEGENGGMPGTRALFGLLVPPGAIVTAPLYMGPKDYDLLASAGFGFERAVDYGMFRILARPVAVTLGFLYEFTGNYGLAIILATIGVRMIFFPLSQSSMKSMRKMQQLQPQMNSIRAKYKGVKDVQKRQEMNTEVMQLYKDNGVSPLGGCLPMLLQMPVLFGFYAAISVSIGIRQAPFVFWLQDLSKMDPYYVLPLLMGASMFVQQRMSPGTGDPVQQRIFRLMPIMFTFFFLKFPSGLVIYWLVNTVLGIAQQAYVNHQLGAPDAKTTPNPKKIKASTGAQGGGAKRKKRGKR